MKRIFLFLLIGMMIGLFGCKKEEPKKTYYLTFEAFHNFSEYNPYTNPGAYYSWSIDDEDGNNKYDKSGSIYKETLTGTATAYSGDWVWIYISVNDVYDYGHVSCVSNDGFVNLWAYTDNLYINESDYETLKIKIDDKDTLITVKRISTQLK